MDMTKYNLKVMSLTCATAIYTVNNFFAFNSYDGQNLKPFLCISSTVLPLNFIDDLEISKIVKLNQGYSHQLEDISSIVLSPLFGFTNQKFVDLLSSLFIKYQL